MISPRAKETLVYFAGCVAVVTITLGASAALIYMGLGFMRRIAGG